MESIKRDDKFVRNKFYFFNFQKDIMELLSQYYEEKLKLVRDMNKLARDNPEEVEAVLLEVNNEKQMMKNELNQMREEIKSWKDELEKARR